MKKTICMIAAGLYLAAMPFSMAHGGGHRMYDDRYYGQHQPGCMGNQYGGRYYYGSNDRNNYNYHYNGNYHRGYGYGHDYGYSHRY